MLVFAGVDVHAVSQADSTDSWVGEDKLKHLAVSAWLTGAGVLAVTHQSRSENRARKVVVPAVMLIGVGKELVDSRKPNGYFSWKDLTADLVGIALALVVLNQ